MKRILLLIALLFIGTSSSNADQTININSTDEKQTIWGFGATFTDPQKGWLKALPSGQQNRAYDKLFRNDGNNAGLTIAQIRVEYVDFKEDMDDGTWDFNGVKTQSLKWLTQKAAWEYGVFHFIARVSSPAGWMKDSGVLPGGSLLPEYYNPYGKSLKEWVMQFDGEWGVPILQVTPCNEPTVEGDYPTCIYSPDQLDVVADKVVAHMAYYDSTIMVGIADGKSYADTRDFWDGLSSATQSKMSYLSTHAYHGQGNQLKNLNKPVLHTEICQVYGEKDLSMTEAMKWVKNYIHPSMQRFEVAWLHWLFVADTSLSGNRSLVLVNTENDTLTFPKRLFTLGQYSRFLQPGNIVVYSRSDNDDILPTVAKTPTGKMRAVVANKSANYAMDVTITGLTPNSTLTVRRTSDTEDLQWLTNDLSVDSAGTVTFKLKENSVTSFREN
ncbi:MAG: hypothetical protein PVI90_17360 [Desulfobacteraceae bacterium]|jgi:glucuronoarabinoxylan endo-1,4-beta-xylanase